MIIHVQDDNWYPQNVRTRQHLRAIMTDNFVILMVLVT